MHPKHKTTFVSKQKAAGERNWYILDASGKILGRFASEVAKILRGKHKPNFTPNSDTGDGVIIVNAEKIVVTGSKEVQKLYRSYTGSIGGLKEVPYQEMQKKHPDRILSHAVKGMLPKTKLGKTQIKKLKIFKGSSHNMQAQNPIEVKI